MNVLHTFVKSSSSSESSNKLPRSPDIFTAFSLVRSMPIIPPVPLGRRDGCPVNPEKQDETVPMVHYPSICLFVH